MNRTHYEVLGLKPACTPEEIRSAYRKLVLKHHPDRSKAPESKAIFMAATEAHEVLSDPERRRHYDALLKTEAVRRAEAQRKANEAKAAPTPPKAAPPKAAAGPRPTSTTLASEITRLTLLHSRSQSLEAEKLAREILQRDSRQPIPYAVLGDIARSRGRLDEAAKMYAYAAQMDARNPVYQRKYEELLQSSRITETKTKSIQMEAQDQKLVAPAVGTGMVALCGMYLVLSREAAILPGLGLVSSWTLGLVVMLFLSGVVVGTSLSLGNLVDRFQAVALNSLGRISPVMALASVAIVNFWAAALLYGLIGSFQRSFNFSTTRLMGGVGAATLMLALFSLASPVLAFGQVFLWGGNLIYGGAICGWMVADSLKR